MLVRCVDCNRFSLNADRVAAAAGMGICAVEPIKSVRWKALVAKHCERFEPAGPSTVEPRMAWLESKQIIR